MTQQVVLAALVALVVGLLVSPFVQRVTRWRAPALARRDRFTETLSQLIVAAGFVKLFDGTPATDPRSNDAIKKERDRYLGRISESTEYLMDNVTGFLLTYPRFRAHQAPIFESVFTLRLTWISRKSDETRLGIMLDMAGKLEEFVTSRPWRYVQRHTELVQALNDVDGGNRLAMRHERFTIKDFRNAFPK